jgi:hypothetical protein
MISPTQPNTVEAAKKRNRQCGEVDAKDGMSSNRRDSHRSCEFNDIFISG